MLYVYIAIAFILSLFQRKKLHRYELIFFVLFITYLIYSILSGNALSGEYFINDVMFILIAFLFLFSFRWLNNINYDLIFLSLSSGYFISKILVLITGIGLEVTNYTSVIVQKNALFDPVEYFLILYCIHSFFYPLTKNVRLVSFLNLLLFSFGSILLGYVHGGAMVMIFVSLIYCLIRNIKYLLILSGVLIFILTSLTLPSINNDSNDSVLSYKLQKVTGLAEFMFDDNFGVYSLPRSTQVRVIETLNLLDQPLPYIMLGKGFGGYLEQSKYYYGRYLNKDDYSEDQIRSKKFYVLHSINQLLLKHGVIFIALIVLMGMKMRKRINKNYVDVSIIFILFSYAFTIKPYLILSLFLISFIYYLGIKKTENTVHHETKNISN
ncbi:hypothetical protein ABRP32_19770 [Providencia manganoxydans]|uniref:hypothetical protein n=1 Tax=Providencia manganoxydans TaxID=2923283 RepID=UPI00111333BF